MKIKFKEWYIRKSKTNPFVSVLLYDLNGKEMQMIVAPPMNKEQMQTKVLREYE